MENLLTPFRCNDCGRLFMVEMADEEESVVCPVCTVPRAIDEGTDVERIEV
jgi:DNA-directed RNA polymerase subunit RPC12/RpoP